ncbi:leucine-rich repeat-containing protein 59-like [Anthonomus grandis grandis]|uniref:leucine-rich repeat-containing protein 59-like n=1 Tax=Anthonomus grandis grandis TaxID=2921223 RepID=UPI0021669214|nr:leucine-rich repeat-containing protein 59-like [Anthonomus grandis grandis]
MSQKTKINVKERFSDGEIDLSMSDLSEVPVKEIAALKKTFSLDLSNNRLTSLPDTFISLTFLTKLDLSKNELTELPEEFGQLSKLKYLDLYKNNLERLPLSFGQFTALRFLDLKDNPLIPTIAKVAGPCVDNKGCQQCARDIVQFYRRLQAEVDSEVEMSKKARQKQLEINQQKKQEEKKKLKKEKQKQNKDIAPEAIKANGTSSSSSKKKLKKEQKKNKHIQESSIIKTFVKFIFFSLLLCLVALWFIFALDLPVTQPMRPKITEFYGQFLEKLPPNFKPYGQYISDSVVLLQNGTRQGIEHLRNCEVVQIAVTKVQGLVNSFTK